MRRSHRRAYQNALAQLADPQPWEPGHAPKFEPSPELLERVRQHADEMTVTFERPGWRERALAWLRPRTGR